MTRTLSDLSRDERIALAAHAILKCCTADCQMVDGFERCLDAPVLVEFSVLTPSMHEAIKLNHRAADAIMFDCGFAGISYSPPRKDRDGYVCAIRVPVGAPEADRKPAGGL